MTQVRSLDSQKPAFEDRDKQRRIYTANAMIAWNCAVIEREVDVRRSIAEPTAWSSEKRRRIWIDRCFARSLEGSAAPILWHLVSSNRLT